jgi:hypothetical protein
MIGFLQFYQTYFQSVDALHTSDSRDPSPLIGLVRAGR